jgi:hypothetical protein
MPLLFNVYLETLRTLWELLANATSRPPAPVAQPLSLPVAQPVNVPVATPYVTPDLADFASAIPWEQKPFYPCTVCGAYMGWGAPSGVCSPQCLRVGQGFPPHETPVMPAAAQVTKPRRKLADYIRRIRKPEERLYAQQYAGGYDCVPPGVDAKRAAAIRAKVDELRGGAA